MIGFLLRAAISALGLWLADYLLGGLTFSSPTSLLLGAVLLGIANAIIRPVFFFITLPLTVLTLGLFIFVVNGAMVGLVGWILPGMTVDGLWPAVLTAIIVGLTSWVASWFIGGDGKVRSARGRD